MSRISSLSDLWTSYRRAAAERVAVRQLSRLSDQLLADMGLERSSIRDLVHTGRRRS